MEEPETDLNYLGYALHRLSGLHPGERCRHLDEAVAYYKRRTEEEKCLTYDVDVNLNDLYREVIVVDWLNPDLDENAAKITNALAKLTEEERWILGWGRNWQFYYDKNNI